MTTTGFVAGDQFQLASSAINCRAGAISGLQPATPQSYCYEGIGLSSAAVGEDWSTSTYSSSKGGMGNTSPTKIFWRLPTIYDFQQANIDGIRFVLPDAGIPGTGGNWSTTIDALNIERAWVFNTKYNSVWSYNRDSAFAVRCVGR